VFILPFHLAPKHSLYLQSFPYPTELFIAASSDDVLPNCVFHLSSLIWKWWHYLLTFNNHWRSSFLFSTECLFIICLFMAALLQKSLHLMGNTITIALL